MKRASTLFLKMVIVLIAAATLTALLGFPHIEGRNANADLTTMYFRDPFLAYIYATSIPFFVALYQAMKLLGHIDNNKAFSELSVRTLRNIKRCAFAIGILLTPLMPYVLQFGQEDDAPGAVLMGVVVIFASFVVATFAAVLQKLIQNAVDIKSENDLTV